MESSDSFFVDTAKDTVHTGTTLSPRANVCTVVAVTVTDTFPFLDDAFQAWNWN